VDRIYLRVLFFGALFALPAGLIVIANSFWPNGDLFQPNGFYLGSDFVNYWVGGRLAVTGRADIVYDLVRYNGLLRDWFAPELRIMNFSYPPHALILLSIVGVFPYLVALPLWSLAGATGFIAVALGRMPRRGDGRLLWALALAPVVWVNVIFGQFGLLLSVLFVGALRVLPTRPILAGVLIGALTVKPQLGLLLAPMLILLGAWRAIAAATATAALLVALSVAAFGLEPWRVYIADTMPFQWHFIEVMDGFYRFQMVTPFTALWFLGVPVGTALALQSVISVLVALAALVVVRSAAPWPLKASVVAFGSVLMVPYVLAYDLAIPLAALVWCLNAGELRADAVGIGLVGAVWALPFGLGILSQTQGLPLLPLVLIAFYAWLVKEAVAWRRADAPASAGACKVRV
jgi:alpha-1,2-mannosyltransferase